MANRGDHGELRKSGESCNNRRTRYLGVCQTPGRRKRNSGIKLIRTTTRERNAYTKGFIISN